MNDKDLSGYLKLIDHTLLKQDASLADVKKCCEEAVLYGFYSVITQPYYIADVKKFLKGSGVLCGSVIGFPFGAEFTDVKVYQAKRATGSGAEETDMVMAISALKNKDYDYVLNDIKAVVFAAKVPVKIILETALLTQEEIIKACNLCIEAGAAFVKTSTGYFGGGATVENVKIMSEVCGGRIKVKAAGGIRVAEDLINMVNAGASRIGTSGGVNIAKGLINTQKY